MKVTELMESIGVLQGRRASLKNRLDDLDAFRRHAADVGVWTDAVEFAVNREYETAQAELQEVERRLVCLQNLEVLTDAHDDCIVGVVS